MLFVPVIGIVRVLKFTHMQMIISELVSDNYYKSIPDTNRYRFLVAYL